MWALASYWPRCCHTLRQTGLRDRRQIMAHSVDWLVDSYVVTNLTGSFKNVTICYCRKSEIVKMIFKRTKQILDDVIINQSIVKLAIIWRRTLKASFHNSAFGLTPFFYKNIVYKNVEAEIWSKIKNILRTYKDWERRE